MTNDLAIERLLEHGLREIAPPRAPEQLMSDIATYARHERQRPLWFASLTESPMRYHSKLVVGSPTTRATALVLAAALVVALGGAMFAAASFGPAPGPQVLPSLTTPIPSSPTVTTLASATLVPSPSASWTAESSVMPVLSPCPSTPGTRPCVAFGTSLLQDWKRDGTMSAINPGFLEASFAHESTFTIRFGSTSGDGFTVTGPAFVSGIVKAGDPRLSIHLTGPFLAHVPASDKTDCVLSVSSLPPPAIRGQFGCGPNPGRTGTGVSGQFAASAAPGALAFGLPGMPVMFEAGLTSPIDPSEPEDAAVDLVYEVAILNDTDPTSTVEITGTPSTEGTLANAHVRFTGYPEGDVDAPCDVRLVRPSAGPWTGSFTCSPTAMGESYGGDAPLEGTFTAWQ